MVASRLSAERLRALCGNDPTRRRLAVLHALAEDAAAKARQTSQHLEEFVFSDHIDPSVDHMVAAAAAPAALAGWPEARVEALLEQIAQVAAVRAGELAVATVAETGIGDAADKTYKNRFASLEVNRSLQGKPGVGRWSTDERGVTEIASPVGVVSDSGRGVGCTNRENTAQRVWWAREGLNLRPLPYQQNPGNRCATQRSPRSPSTVAAEGKH